MTDYYEILGVEEEASIEEIEARVSELIKRYSLNSKEGGEANERIKEIKEAYEILKNPSTRKEYDFDRVLKRSVLEKILQRRKERLRKKKIFVFAGAVVLFLVAGLFTLEMARLTIQQKRITPTSAPVLEEKRPTSVLESVPTKIPKAPDKKTSQTIPEQMAESQEAIPPVTKLPKKEVEPKEKTAQETVISGKPISNDMPKAEVLKSPEAISKEIPKVERSKPVSTEPRPATAYVPVPEKVQKSEVALVTEKETPTLARKEVPREVPKEVLKETPKEPPKEPPKEVPKERIKTTPQEPPASQPSQPIEAKPMDQKSQVAQTPSAKPSPPTAAVPPMPHPFVEENEVIEFLAKYVDRYKQKDIEGFLSFFSPLAIQNQKDRIEKIREMYSKQFERYESFNYQLKDPKMRILENSVKVRASYVIEQFSKKGETKQVRGDIEWELIKEGKELKVLTIEYKPEKTK